MAPKEKKSKPPKLQKKADTSGKAGGKPTGRRWFRLPRLTIAGLLLVTVLTSILTAGGIAGIYALSVVYSNKLTDTWAILFLELENQGNQLTQTFEAFRGRPGPAGGPLPACLCPAGGLPPFRRGGLVSAGRCWAGRAVPRAPWGCGGLGGQVGCQVTLPARRA